MKARPYTDKPVPPRSSRDAGIVVVVSVILSMVALVAFSATLPA